MANQPSSTKRVVEFLRKRDYVLVRELAGGACGKTVLLHDDLIDEDFVCKKYAPCCEENRQALYSNFVREIKLLHGVHHDNVVRVFNYYLYPDDFTGYILMEFVDGSEIDEYVRQHPETINELFVQAASGFCHLEQCEVLHRDIRPGNLMVSRDGTLKIIDLGFGKRARSPDDFKKTITLNWWCELPDEFAQSTYDFASEVYFVGQLFAKLIADNGIGTFKHNKTLARMCQRNVANRIRRFSDVKKAIRKSTFSEIPFHTSELRSYRAFSDALHEQIERVHHAVKYTDDVNHIRRQLRDVYDRCMLEEEVPDAGVVISCFLDGSYYYTKRGLQVRVVKDFLELLVTATEDKARTILANLHTRLDTIPRFSTLPPDDDLPF